MSEVNIDTLYAITEMTRKVSDSGTNRALGYALGGRKAAIVSLRDWIYLRHDDSRLIDVDPREWLDQETLFKRLEVSLIERMVAGEE